VRFLIVLVLLCNDPRPAGIVVFAKPDSVDTVLNEWAANVPKLLEIVERTCHLVHKQNMMSKMN